MSETYKYEDGKLVVTDTKEVEQISSFLREELVRSINACDASIEASKAVKAEWEKRLEEYDKLAPPTVEPREVEEVEVRSEVI